MQVVYKNNLDDLIAVNNNQITHSTDFKKKKLWNLYGIPFLVLSAFLLLAYITNRPSFYAGGIAGSLTSYLWALYFYKSYPTKVAKQTQQQKEVFCEHTVIFTPDGVREKTENSESYHTWAGLNNISITEEYIFVYNTPITAHIIPKRAIGESEFLQVKNIIAKYQST